MNIEVGDMIPFDETPDGYPFGAEGKVVYINECTVFVLVYDSSSLHYSSVHPLAKALNLESTRSMNPERSSGSRIPPP